MSNRSGMFICFVAAMFLLVVQAPALQLVGSQSRSAADPSFFTADGSDVSRLLEEIARIKAAGGVPGRELYDELARYYPAPSDRGRSLDQGNDTCPATVIPSVPYTDTGTTVGRVNNQTTCLANTAPDVIYSFTPTTTANYAISLCGSGYDTILELRTSGACPGAVNIGCNDDACGTSSHMVATLNSGTTYFIIVDGYASEAGAYTLNVALSVPCDVNCQPGDELECAEVADSSHARLDCDGGCNPLAFGGTANFAEIACGQTVCGSAFTYVRQAASLRDTDWFQFTIGNTQDVLVTVTSEFSTVFGILDIDDCVVPSFFTASLAVPCISQTVTVSGLAAGTYAVFVAPSQFTGIPAPQTYRLTLNACSDCDYSEAATVISSVIDTIGTKASALGYCIPVVLPPGSVVEDYSTGTMTPVGTASRLYWVNPGSSRMFDHSLYYVVVDTASGSISQIIDGQSWPIVNGFEWTIELMSAHAFYIGNTIDPPDVFFVPDPLPVPYNLRRRDHRESLDDPSKWAVLISQGDTAGNGYEAKCSRADIDCARASLAHDSGPNVPDTGFTTHISPTWAEVCTTLARLGRANPPCDKLYIYYTGHGSATGARLHGTTLTWAEIARKIKETNAKEVCVIWQSCKSGRLTDELAKIGVPGYHITSTTADGESTWELPGDPVAGSPVSRFVWQCMQAGYEGQDLYAWALTQWNAYNHWYCNSLHDQVVRRRITAADSARLKNYWVTTTPPPTGAQTGGTTKKGGSVMLPPAAACSTLCFTFYAPAGSCANATLFCQRIVGSDTTWVQARHWNFNRNETRYFNPFENPDPNSTGRYRIVNDGNSDTLNVKIVWLLTRQPSTPNSVYANAIPSHSVGWSDGINQEFNPTLAFGTFTTTVLDGYNTYEIPRCFGPAWPDTFRWNFPLAPHPEHPWLYNGGLPSGGFSLPSELRIEIAGVFRDFVPQSFGLFEVHLDFVDNPGGIYTHLVQTVQTFLDFETNTYTPVVITIPPVLRPYQVTASLTYIQSNPYQIAVDGATFTSVGNYNEPPQPCNPVANVRLIRLSGQVHVYFAAPQDALYNIYSTTNPNNDRNPDGGLDPNFTLEGQLPGATGQALHFVAPPTTAVYKNYVVVADCGPGSDLPRNLEQPVWPEVEKVKPKQVGKK